MRKYTRELLEPLVRSSNSVSSVLRKLGLNMGGNSHSLISKRIKEYKINTSHFKNGNQISATNNRKKPEDYLVLRDKPLVSVILRKAMIAIGLKYECSGCGLGPSWNGKPLTLHAEHKNGNRCDCRPNNLEFLCPNCHTQTETFGKPKKILNGKNEPKTKKVKIKPSIDDSKYPSNLEELIWKVPMTTLAKEFGVTDRAIAKRCKKLGIQTPPIGYWRRQGLKADIV